MRLVRCVSGSVDLSMTCEPSFDYGQVEPTWDYAGDGYGEVVATAEGVDLSLRLTTDLRPGIEGPGLHARTRMTEGESHFVALSWSPLPPPRTLLEAEDAAAPHLRVLAAVDHPGHVPRPPVAQLPAAQRPHPQGTDVRPDGRPDRRRDDLAARDAAGRAQLGLPLRLGPGLDVRPLGAVHPRVRQGGRRLLLLRRRHVPGRPRPAGHVRRRRRAGAGREHRCPT